jgi:hypothetical protein
MILGTLSVIVNNICGPYFKIGKGVGQGDPLSPFLFNIAADSLAKMVISAQKNNLLNPHRSSARICEGWSGYSPIC